MVSATANRVGAQSTVVASEPHYGGQLVQELIPYQPNILFAGPPEDPTPLFLDESPEFCQPIETDVPLLMESAEMEETSELPPGVRKSLFQKLFFTGTYVPQFDSDSLGFGELEAGVVFGVPFFRVTAPLLITPRFAVSFLDRPDALDLPSKLYEAEVSFRHLRKFGDSRWAMNAAVTLGEYSDFEQSDADAFRVTGQAFAVYERSPATTWVMGVVYLNRKNVSVVPALGLIYKPNSNVTYEAIFPRPRILWRLPGSTIENGDERWFYVGGELGGGVWSITRTATQTQDLVTYNDYRFLIGLERKAPIGKIGHRLEMGYIFGRELEFTSGTPDYRLDDSLFLRAALTY